MVLSLLKLRIMNHIKARNFILLFALMFSGAVLRAQNTCPQVHLANPQASFELEALLPRIGAKNPATYEPEGEIHLIPQTRIVNQGNAEECFLFGFMGTLETYNASLKGRNKSPPISTAYFTAQKLLEYAKEVFTEENPGEGLEGGNFPDALILLRQYGFVPEGSWKPKKPFHTWKMKEIYTFFKKNIAAQKKNLNQVAKIHGKDSPVFKEASKASFKIFTSFMEQFTGVLPDPSAKILKWRGKLYSALELDELYGFDHKSKLIVDYVARRGRGYKNSYMDGRMRDATIPYGGKYELNGLSFEGVEESMMAQIDQGLPVTLDLRWDWDSDNDFHSIEIVGYETRENAKGEPIYG